MRWSQRPLAQRPSSCRCAGENDGEVTVTAEGGSGAAGSDDGVNFADGNVATSTGSYTFFVQDEFGCSGTVTANVSEPAAVRSRALCRRRRAGEGHRHQHHRRCLLPVRVDWPRCQRDRRPGLDQHFTGVYIVEVTDANDCSADETFDLTTSVQKLQLVWWPPCF